MCRLQNLINLIGGLLFILKITNFYSMIKRLLISSFVFFSLQFNTAQETQKKFEQIIREWATPDEFPEHVILSATEDPSSSIAINWRTHSSNTVGYVDCPSRART